MSLRSGINVLFFCAVAVGLAAIVATSTKPMVPVTASVVKVADLESTKRVTVEFRRCNPAAHFAEAHEVQIRVADRWQPPLRLPRFEDGNFLMRTNSQRLVFDFPRQTQACRFLLGYRVGPPPYCRAYFFLSRHGWSQKFPKLSRVLLNCVRQWPTLKRVECELKIPTPTQKASPEAADVGVASSALTVVGVYFPRHSVVVRPSLL
jgi:hypothetical protein